jgi:hypothetical protein
MGDESMRRAFGKIWISVVGVAIVMGVASCGGTDAPTATSPPADPKVAFTQYEGGAKPFECSKAYGEMYDAFHDKHYGIMKDRARQHRDVVATWDAQLSEIAFPAAAQPIVDKMHEIIATELTGLNELVGVDDRDAGPIWTLIAGVQADDASVIVEGNRLRAALGHPVSQAKLAADQLNSADTTFWKAKAAMQPKWTAALEAKDLDGARAANALEEDALARYIDTLGTIDWPPGTFEGQANALGEMLRKVLEFDRRQDGVAAVAEIVEVSEDGLPTSQNLADAVDAMWNPLAQANAKVEPSKC